MCVKMEHALSKKFGMLWHRDSEKEKISETIKNAYIYYADKYKEKAELIECSDKDIQEEFIYENAIVLPKNIYSSGTIWVTSSSQKG